MVRYRGDAAALERRGFVVVLPFDVSSMGERCADIQAANEAADTATDPAIRDVWRRLADHFTREAAEGLSGGVR